MRFHPASDMPIFETQRRLRGHAFYPGNAVLRRLLPREDRPAPEEAPCVVYFSPWGHLVVTEIDAELNAYGWVCWSHDPDSAEWGDIGFLGEYEKRRAPLPSVGWWERDLRSGDPNAAAAVARILTRYDRPEAAAPQSAAAEPEAAAPAARPVARLPRTSRGVMSARR
ncbi:hypothetical protein AB0G49_14235 [Streptomyces longwoodensis]|uniref:hypothetical protein n=1 Tax=Streptomyces longwoodensis TaxID=68231 RepID=UPI0033F61679